jgi:hypothetical protein
VSFVILRRFSVVVLAVAALAAQSIAPAPVAAQDVDPLSRLDPNSRFAIELILDSARIDSVPTRPLLSKTLEGIAKRKDGRLIVKTVRAHFASLREARKALGSSMTETEWTAAASALQAGVPANVLAKFRTNRPAGPKGLAMPLVVLADLITRGVPIDTASSAIVQLWQGGAADGDFYGLWKGVEQDILSGQNPGTALQQRIRESTGRGSPGSKLPPASPAREPENTSS